MSTPIRWSVRETSTVLWVLATACSSSSGTTPDASSDGPQTQDASVDASLTLTNGTVYDANQDVTWLADADFPISPTGQAIQAAMNVTGIAADGTMNYQTAIAWVNALNAYPQTGCSAGQTGYLCRNDWQLPVTPPTDPTCTTHAGTNGFSFGPNCKGSAFGSLFYAGLGLTYPTSVASLGTAIAPFEHLGPPLFWTTDTNGGGEQTFTFLLDIKFGNTTSYNLLRVLPMSPGAIANSPPAGTGVVPYTSGKGAGLAVFDSITGNTWALDANLAASNAFGVTGALSVPASANDNAITMPLVAPDGVVHFSAVTSWINGMNQSAFAGASNWELPAYLDIATLFTDLGMKADDTALLNKGSTGPFTNFQPFFYWACPASQGAPSRCDYAGNAGVSSGQVMQWAFNFDTGFEGTDEAIKRFFTLVYHPGH